MPRSRLGNGQGDGGVVVEHGVNEKHAVGSEEIDFTDLAGAAINDDFALDDGLGGTGTGGVGRGKAFDEQVVDAAEVIDAHDDSFVGGGDDFGDGEEFGDEIGAEEVGTGFGANGEVGEVEAAGDGGDGGAGF